MGLVGLQVFFTAGFVVLRAFYTCAHACNNRSEQTFGKRKKERGRR
jgi:hypothetical protein